MGKPSIKSITVKNLITFLLLAAVSILIVIGINFRSISHKIIENKAITISELIIAGLTSHMKAGMMDKRDYYLNEIRSLHEVNNVAIIRSRYVTDQFGLGHKLEKESDLITKEVFESKKPMFILDEFNVNPTIRAVIPYISTKEGTLNCLTCHNVDEGMVLGAVDIELDLKEYQRMAITVFTIILILSTIFIVLIIFNTLRTIQVYIKEPLDNLLVKARESYQKQEPMDFDRFKSLEFEHVAKEINLFNSEIIAAQNLLQEKNIELTELNNEIEETLKETVFTMGVIEEERSVETKNHTKRVTQYSNLLASKLGLSEKDVNLITAASPLHDIGKLGMSDTILIKPGKLTPKEYHMMENHARIGHAMLIHSERDLLKAAAIIALQHHEKWDGSGYPQGLKEKEIHIYGRIVALADVFDALITDRVYKDAWSLEEIIQYIKEERGKQFDPDLVDIFLDNIDEFVRIKKRY
jgi:response regulator RpfG family c-di-GMP phosphodiesterase